MNLKLFKATISSNNFIHFRFSSGGTSSYQPKPSCHSSCISIFGFTKTATQTLSGSNITASLLRIRRFVSFKGTKVLASPKGKSSLANLSLILNRNISSRASQTVPGTFCTWSLLIYYDKRSLAFCRMNLIPLSSRKRTTFSRENVCFLLQIDKTCVRDVFFLECPFNTETRLLRTLWHALLVNVLTGFHCCEAKRIFSRVYTCML